MKYRKFGKLDFQVSALGFGCMRLPRLADDKTIDEPEAIRMIRHAIDQGVNYIDTAYMYHSGKSEGLVGKALLDGYRAKVKIATKFPLWNVNNPDDYDKILNEQLQRLQTDSIDFYLFHGVDDATWATVTKFNLLKKAEAAVKDGRIKHIAFSFHAGYDLFVKIIDSFDKWAMCQIQYNYFDVEKQAGMKGLKYAASKGLAVIAMEPLLGGKLSRPPQKVKDVFDAAKIKRSYSDWALQWLWNQPEVTMVLSGMSTFQQVDENLNSVNNSGVNSLSAEELKIVEKAQQTFKNLVPFKCTGCSYCMPCPNGVDIPWNFELYNRAFLHGSIKDSRETYSKLDKTSANECTGCTLCEDKCPQKLPISESMPKVHQVLGEGKDF